MRYRYSSYRQRPRNEPEKSKKEDKIEAKDVEVVEIQPPKVIKPKKNPLKNIFGNLKTDDIILIFLILTLMNENLDKDDEILIPILIYIFLD